MPRVSIGLPVYNGDQYLSQAIESILSQTLTDFELVISDNGSTDGTQNICEAFAGRDSRIRYHRSPMNRGAAWNFQRVFELSTTIYFKWAACDDLIAPRHLETCVRVLDQHADAVLAYPKTRVIDENGEFIEDHLDGYDLRSPKPHVRFCGSISASRRCYPMFGLIRASSLKRTSLLGNYPSSDYILLSQLALLGEIHEIPERLYFRRQHDSSGSTAHARPEAQAVFLDPRNRGKRTARWFRLLTEYLLSIHRAPISLSEQLQCYVVMLKWCYWGRNFIAKEALDLVTNLGQPPQVP